MPNTEIYLTFTGLCIVIYSYNKSQQDALFLRFILVKNSTCFGQTYCPSSGVLILYSQHLVFVILIMLTVCQRGQDGTALVRCQLFFSVYFVIPYCCISLIQFFFGVILICLFCLLGIDEFDIHRTVHHDMFL